MFDLAAKMRAIGDVRFVKPDVDRPPTSEELGQIARDHGAVLPDDYKSFVQEFGGGMPKKWIEFPVLQLAPGDPTPTRSVDLFAGGGVGRTSLLRLIRIYKARMPETLLPVATAPGGDLICLGVAGEDAGKVYFWDHENEWDAEDRGEGTPLPRSLTFQNIILVAHSFGDFIRSMQAKDI